VLGSGEFTAGALDLIDRLAAEEMDAAVITAHAGSTPLVETLHTDVYATY
jgi:hypothetical protein